MVWKLLIEDFMKGDLLYFLGLLYLLDTEFFCGLGDDWSLINLV